MSALSVTLLEWKGADLTSELAEELLARFRECVTAGKHPRRLFGVTVEMLQNLRLHAQGPMQIQVVLKQDAYVVTTENVVDAETAAHLSNRLDAINRMSEAQLKEAITKRRRAHLPPGSRGAGIGLMEIRRLSGGLLYHEVIPVISQYRLVLGAGLTHNSGL